MTSLYDQIEARYDQAIYHARQAHRHRTSVMECQITAALGDAIMQARNGRKDFARIVLEIVEDVATLKPWYQSAANDLLPILRAELS